MNRIYILLNILTLIFFLICSSSALADDWSKPREGGFVRKMLEKQQNTREANKKNGLSSEKGFYTKGMGKSHQETFAGRDYIVYTPPNLPPKGRIPMIVALHGGFGNAGHLQNYLGLDALADQHGFIVAYLNGMQVAGLLPAKMRGWNAGGCCGQPHKKNIDDVGFIGSVIDAIAHKYGVDPNQVYGTGHSNGAMMTIRLMCETDFYRAAAVYSGVLQMDVKTCPAAKGKRVVNIHGTEDKNLPIEGGYTKEGFNKKTNYKSQSFAQEIFRKSGGDYELILLEGAAHQPETLNAVLWKTEGLSLSQMIVRELGLD